MAERKLVTFLPCRAGSARVPQKNTRRFAGREGGLLEVKLEQLAKSAGIDCVVVDSNDPVVLERAEAYRRVWPRTKELIVRSRPDSLGQSSTSTDALIAYALDTLDGDDLLWTHVTSPMVSERVYERALACYLARGDEHDSLMSVHRLQGFLWDERGPINYDPGAVRWPRTQDLQAVYQVDSGIFLVPFELARARRDRIGTRPQLFELSALEAVDVDWESDFRIAEILYGASA